MLPKWHILWGLFFTILIWIFAPNINFIYLIIIFLASFLIDFDHYVVFSKHTGKLSLRHNYIHAKKLRKKEEIERKKGTRERGPFFLFHTLEFHFLVALLGLVWIGFFYAFLGMVFHSLLDMFDLTYNDRFYRREYFLFNWLASK